MNEVDRLLTCKEVQTVLGIRSRQTILNLEDRGILSPVRITPGCVRWRPVDVGKLIAHGAPGIDPRPLGSVPKMF